MYRKQKRISVIHFVYTSPGLVSVIFAAQYKSERKCIPSNGFWYRSLRCLPSTPLGPSRSFTDPSNCDGIIPESPPVFLSFFIFQAKGARHSHFHKNWKTVYIGRRFFMTWLIDIHATEYSWLHFSWRCRRAWLLTPTGACQLSSSAVP